MHLIAIDPGVRKSGLVIWWGDPPQLMDVGLVSTNQLLLMPGRFIALTHDTHRIAIVEGQYIDRRSKVATKSILKLARVAGRIDMRLEMLGFEMIEAPAWGKNSWVSIFSTGGVLPHREQLKSMSVWWASAAYPSAEWNEHTAAAFCMGQWWLDKQQWEQRVRVCKP